MPLAIHASAAASKTGVSQVRLAWTRHTEKIVQRLAARFCVRLVDMLHVPPALLQRAGHDKQRVDSKLFAHATKNFSDGRLHDRQFAFGIVGVFRATAGRVREAQLQTGVGIRTHPDWPGISKRFTG